MLFTTVGIFGVGRCSGKHLILFDFISSLSYLHIIIFSDNPLYLLYIQNLNKHNNLNLLKSL